MVLLFSVSAIASFFGLLTDPIETIREIFSGLLVVGFSAVFLGTIGFAIAFTWTGLVSLLTLPAIAGVLRVLAFRPQLDRLAAFAGSAVAVLATLPIGITAGYSISSGGMLAGGILGSLAIGLAIAMGQAAGQLTTIREVRRRRLGKLPEVEARRGFTTWTLLIATAVISFALGLLKSLGMLTAEVAIAGSLGIFLGWAVERPVRWGLNRWLDRKKRLRRASRRFT